MYVYKEEDAPLLVRPLLLFIGWKTWEDKGSYIAGGPSPPLYLLYRNIT